MRRPRTEIPARAQAHEAVIAKQKKLTTNVKQVMQMRSGPKVFPWIARPKKL